MLVRKLDGTGFRRGEGRVGVIPYLRLTVAEIVFTMDREKWAISWLLAAGQILARPVSTGIATLILILFVADLVLGVTRALLSGTFQYRRIGLSLVKGAVYSILLVTASVLSCAQDLGFLPMIGLLAGTVLEGFLLLTEAASVITNADSVLELCGVRIPVLHRLARFLDREAHARAAKLLGDESRRHLSILLITGEEQVELGIRRALSPPEPKPDLGAADDRRVFLRAYPSIPGAIRELRLGPTEVDVVLLDVGLATPPAKGVAPLGRLLTAVGGRVPVVVLAPGDDPELAVEAVRLGAADVVGGTELGSLRSRLFAVRERFDVVAREIDRRLRELGVAPAPVPAPVPAPAVEPGS